MVTPTLCLLPPQPSATLSKRLAACEPNPEKVLSARVADMVAAVIPNDAAAGAAQPFPMALPNAGLERRAEVRCPSAAACRPPSDA